MYELRCRSRRSFASTWCRTRPQLHSSAVGCGGWGRLETGPELGDVERGLVLEDAVARGRESELVHEHQREPVRSGERALVRFEQLPRISEAVPRKSLTSIGLLFVTGQQNKLLQR